MTNKDHLPLLVAGLIFAIIAIMHVIRIIYHAKITVAGHIIPMNASYIGALVAFLLTIWMFKASKQR